ncbi:MAG: N-acetylmuramoyl-L-alanine amidase CwlD [Gorillibacterium sp.]|nr:N-acetylmuramoyl-L-alanine amidase CwlD [Gorillibacterium sp.]
MRKFRKRVVVWMTLSGKIKIVLSLVLLLMIVLVFSDQLPFAKSGSTWSLPLSGKVITIDAGHGGPDGGAVSESGTLEKDITLAICLYLRDYLQQSGAIVWMTRETDTDLAQIDTKGLGRRKREDLIQRAQAITENKTDLLVSVHLNSIPSPKWHGAQSFYTLNHPDNASFAAHIQAELKRNLENTDRMAKPIDKKVYLLRAMKIPSVLVEVGFLSNPEEARLLSQPQYQQKLAASVYQGILKYASGEKPAETSLAE